MRVNAASETPEQPGLPRTAMIGVGSMGGAILQGLRNPSVAITRPIVVTTRSAASAAEYANTTDVTAIALEDDAEANRRAVAGAGLVILAVKPWLLIDAAREIAQALEPGAVVVSVAAGVPSAAIEAVLPAGVAVVRAMPNTPSHIGRGMTGIAGGATASAADVELVRRLFETVGQVIVVREDQINDVAAVSGSGPAYVFLYVEEMIAAAERLGFEAAQARQLVRQTVLGAAELMESSGEDAAQLRRNVTSPKGTTEQAIIELQAGGWPELFDRALAANVRRSRELEAE
ncbi:pyrroline-5-carboxylate reductase [Leucobacter luti]|uniref:Pyrroline-5-carboxylate reductase n=2 Tax=Leucobacter luti TaxID=340320 RepID=A0A4R6RV01_9MICO|nr:pyrroline-5-carboxylate reductase [Leucobacter luti]